jgi:hypothetical protein
MALPAERTAMAVRASACSTKNSNFDRVKREEEEEEDNSTKISATSSPSIKASAERALATRAHLIALVDITLQFSLTNKPWSSKKSAQSLAVS